MANFRPLAAEIGSGVWGTPANFNGFRALAHILVIMVALYNRADHYIFILFLSFFFFFFFFFISSRNLSGRRLDVYHTSAHGVALVRI